MDDKVSVGLWLDARIVFLHEKPQSNVVSLLDYDRYSVVGIRSRTMIGIVRRRPVSVATVSLKRVLKLFFEATRR